MSLDDLQQYYDLDSEIVTKISQKINTYGDGFLYEINAIFRAIIINDADLEPYILNLNNTSYACKTGKYTLIFKKETFINSDHKECVKVVFADLF